MSVRKRIAAEKRKESRQNLALATLRNVPSSPRKMRYVADMIRGMEVFKALGVLKFSNKEASRKMEKLLLSAISNWEQKNERKAEMGELYIKTVFVNEGPTLKRLRPAPRGRAHRIRKRSNHVTLIVDTYNKESEQEQQNNN
ncbi:MAG: 50S ribosomal protein L22 [Dysgonamonadaceae bacterium]|jgi:large subunit ribosomal protein L22